MRWLFFLLLVVNGAYWLYHWRQPPAESAATVTRAADVEPGVATLQLLSEVAPDMVEGAARVPEPRAVADRPGLPAGRCLLLGPVQDVVAARLLRERLVALDVDAELYRVAVVVDTDYWVHIPPLPTRGAATSLHRELRAEGIASFVITDGDLANGISLGFFASRRAALELAERRRAEGYDAAVREMPRSGREYWLAADPAGAPGIAELVWDRVLRDMPGAEVRLDDCESIAGGDKLE